MKSTLDLHERNLANMVVNILALPEPVVKLL